MGKPEKSPYRDYTIEDVLAAEAGHYYIQIGTEIFQSESGKMAFKKDRVDELFESILGGLKEMKKSNNKREVEDAHACLLNFRIFPLRIH